MPATPRLGQTGGLLKLPHAWPTTEEHHAANARQLEQIVNDIPVYAGATAISTSDETAFDGSGLAQVTVPAPDDQIDGLGALYVQVEGLDAAGPAWVYLGGIGTFPYGMLLYGTGPYEGRLAVPWYVGEDLDVSVAVDTATTGTLVVTYVYPV